MELDRLTENGIEKLLNSLPCILQLVKCQQKNRGSEVYIIGQLSDGFSKVSRCIFTTLEGKKPTMEIKNYNVIECIQADVKNNPGRTICVVVTNFKVLRKDLTMAIGEPIDHQIFTQNKMRNPKGNNKIPQLNQNKKKTQELKSTVNYDDLFEQSQHQQRVSSKSLEKNVSNNVSKNTTNVSIPRQNAQIQPQKQNNSKQTSSNFSRSMPHQNLNNMQNQRTIPQNGGRYDTSYTKISQLNQRIQNWKLKVRVIFIIPPRQFVKKNGQESSSMVFYGCDKSGMINFNLYGDVVQSTIEVLKIDQIYQIQTGRVSIDQKSKKFKIILSQKSKINLVPQNDASCPYADQFCQKIAAVVKSDVGTEHMVDCLVKDYNEQTSILTKQGKDLKKKTIILCDPEAKVQLELTLWGQNSAIQFQAVPYIMQGIVVSSYNQKKQYSTSFNFAYRPFKQHSFRRYLGQLNTMQFKYHEGGTSNFSKTFRSISFHHFQNKLEKLHDDEKPIKMEKFCYIYQINIGDKSKCYYMSCPHCRKKVFEERNSVCQNINCKKPYQVAKYRYLLNVTLYDETENIWTTIYDEPSEKLFQLAGINLPADQFVNISENQAKKYADKTKNLKVKVQIAGKRQYYNNDLKLKFGINKLSQADPLQEAKISLSRIAKVLALRKNEGTI